MGVYKKQYIGGIAWKMGLAQFVDLREGVLGIKYRCVFLMGGRGGVDTPVRTGVCLKCVTHDMQ